MRDSSSIRSTGLSSALVNIRWVGRCHSELQATPSIMHNTYHPLLDEIVTTTKTMQIAIKRNYVGIMILCYLNLLLIAHSSHCTVTVLSCCIVLSLSCFKWIPTLLHIILK